MLSPVLQTSSESPYCLDHMALCSIRKDYHDVDGMLPRTLAEELLVYGNRFSSRLKHGLIAPSFPLNTFKTPFPMEMLLIVTFLRLLILTFQPHK